MARGGRESLYMAGDAPSAAEYERRITGLEALVAQQSALIEASVP
jgi:hypothetical protein